MNNDAIDNFLANNNFNNFVLTHEDTITKTKANVATTFSGSSIVTIQLLVVFIMTS